MTVETLGLRAARAALYFGGAAAALALLAPAAAAAPAQRGSADLRRLENPPVLVAEGAQPGLLQGAPGLPGDPASSPDDRNTIQYTFDINMVPGKIYNPWTLSDDPVLLRSYQGTGIDPDVPFMAPTITMRPGQTVRIGIDNNLAPQPGCDGVPDVNTPHCFNTTNLHSHGLWVSPAGNSDNVLLSIPPQTSFTYEYNVPDDHPAGTFWYHPHRHGSTALQVSSGMAGALVITGNRAPTMDTPGDIDVLLRDENNRPYGERVLLFQQAQYACFNAEGKVETVPEGTRWVCNEGPKVKPQQIGEIRDYDQQFSPDAQWAATGRYTSINGRVQPVIGGIMAGRFERWRLVHAGVRESVNLRFYRLRNGAPDFRNVPGVAQARWINDNCTGAALTSWQIAADGLTLARAMPVDQSRLQPGYRADILTWFPAAGQYCVIDDNVANGISGAESKRLLALADVKGAGPAPTDPKATLYRQMGAAAVKAMPRPDQQAVRTAVLDGLAQDLRLDRFVWHKTIAPAELTGRQKLQFEIVTGGPKTLFQVDGQPYKPDRIDRELPLGGVEEWTMTSTLANHPFHIHVNPFQVASVLDDKNRDVTVPGSASFDPDYANMIGQWKDTLFVKKGYTVAVRTRYQRYIGEYVLHCHILDHEDQGMMQNVRVGIPDGNGGIVALGHH